MSTEQEHEQVQHEGDPESHGAEAGATQARQPDWWHRDHPTFTALTGFFTGLAFIIVLPGLFIGMLNWLFSDDTAEDLFPFVLVTLAVPIGLVIAPRTRRFGLYMLIGVVATALVVLGVGGLVLWYMLTYQS
jgi:4-amino-4-deoxy-L-arabinose transferase-like glycosyltransferase